MAGPAPTSSAYRRFAPLLAVILIGAAFWLIWYKFRHVDLHALRAGITAIPGSQILAAFALTALSYLLLTGYDALALRNIQQPLSYGRTALASFVGFTFNMNIGLSVLGGTAVRYRFYSSWGLSAFQIGKIVAFCAITAMTGTASVTGLVFLIGDAPPGAEQWVNVQMLRPLGALLLGAVILYVVLCALLRRPWRVRSWVIALPRPRIALAQVAFAASDLIVVGAMLYVLYPAADVSFPLFLGVYLVAFVAGFVSHVPGGLGVFETVFVSCLPTGAGHADVLATLLVFRAIYFFIPFVIAATLLALHEARRHRREAAVAGV